MHRGKFSYPESFLQWLWREQLFSTETLRTVDGRSLRIFGPGVQNSTDGPDFLNASIQIGSLRMYGSIELHNRANHWYTHQHQKDANYNNVILHVVMEPNSGTIVNQKGDSVPTLNLSSYILPEFHSLFEEYNGIKTLPCAEGVSFISEQAFLDQIEKVHQEYFQKKVDDFFSFYNPELIPSEAWKEALVISLFDGLGITHNRQQMQQAGAYFLKHRKKETGAIKCTWKLAEIETLENAITWNLKGVRKNNHPKKRISEGIAISDLLLENSLEKYLSEQSTSIWEQVIVESGNSYSARYRILFATVYLPALFTLGSLFGAKHLSVAALQQWNTFSAPVPKSLLKEFTSLGKKTNQFIAGKLGAVHQLKAYCKPLRCHQCEVLKKAILS